MRKQQQQQQKPVDNNNQLKTQKLRKKKWGEEKNHHLIQNGEVKCSFMFHCTSCRNNNILLRMKTEMQAFLSRGKIWVLIEHLYEIRILKYRANYPTLKKIIIIKLERLLKSFMWITVAEQIVNQTSVIVASITGSSAISRISNRGRKILCSVEAQIH